MKSAEQWVLFGGRHGFTVAIRQAQAQAYEAGQRDMREAACNTAKTWHMPSKGGLTALEEAVRDLPIKPMTESE